MKQIIEIKPGSLSIVESGDKVITIQKGRRLYNLGAAILIDPLDSKEINVEILRVSYSKLKDIQQVDLYIHGEKNWQKLLEYLQQYYTDIKKDSTITVVRFKKDNKNDKTNL